jgi:hypothetical protein
MPASHHPAFMFSLDQYFTLLKMAQSGLTKAGSVMAQSTCDRGVTPTTLHPLALRKCEIALKREEGLGKWAVVLKVR